MDITKAVSPTRGQIIDAALVAMNEALEFGKVTQSDLEKLQTAIKLGRINPPQTRKPRPWGFFLASLRSLNEKNISREKIEDRIAHAKDAVECEVWVRKSVHARFILSAVRDALWHSHLTQSRMREILAGAIAKNCASGMDESDATKKAVTWTFWVIAKEAKIGKLGEADEEDLIDSLRVIAIVTCTKKVAGDHARGFRMAIQHMRSLERRRVIQTAA